MLVVENLQKRLPQLLIDVPHLKLEEGETFVLLGPTGAGKSSLLELLGGFQHPDQGTIRVNNREVGSLPPEERHIAIVFQEAHLFPHLNVRENVCFGSGEPPLFEKVVRLMGIDSLLDKQIAVLSGGEKQLVALARALMVRPRLLLLDEPFSAIDPQGRKQVIETYRRVRQELQITTLMVTHSFEDGLYLAQRLGVFMQGRLVQTGDPESLFRQPASAAVAMFLGVENLFSGHFELLEPSGVPGKPPADRLEEAAHFQEKGCRPALFKTDSTTLHSLADHEGPGYALVQPQEIILSLEPTRSSALNQLKGRVQKIVPTGSIIQLEVDAGLPFKVFITFQSLQEMGLQVGSPVHLSFKASSVKTY